MGQSFVNNFVYLIYKNIQSHVLTDVKNILVIKIGYFEL